MHAKLEECKGWWGGGLVTPASQPKVNGTIGYTTGLLDG